MANFLKILLLFVILTVPALDIAFLDPHENDNHYTEAVKTADTSGLPAKADFHCICHVIHVGAHVLATIVIETPELGARRFRLSAVLANGRRPAPGLHPPSTLLS